MSSVKNVYFVENFKEFSKVFNKKSYIVSGSTYTFNRFKSGFEGIENIIVINNLPMKYIKTDKNYLKIGALATFDDIENNDVCKKKFSGYLSYACGFCSSQLIRNMATVGGNIAHPNAFNIIPLIVKTLDGKIRILDKNKSKLVSLEEFYALKNKVLVTEIVLPLKYDKNVFYFEKISRIASSWESYITFSFRAEVANSVIKDIRFVFGGVMAVPFCDDRFEKTLTGKKIDSNLIREVAEFYAAGVYNLNPKHKYSDYRKDVTFNTVREFLVKLSKR